MRLNGIGFVFTLGLLAFNISMAQVDVTTNSSKKFQESISDVFHLLNQAMEERVKWDSNHSQFISNAGTIQLSIIQQANNELGTQGFQIVTSSESAIRIEANTYDALSYGLYHYLELLGFRFYMPGETWTIIPELNSMIVEMDSLELVPAFKLRDFFGTYGFTSATFSDPTRKAKHDWAVWKRRNKFGSEYDIRGHSGRAFNEANQEVLKAHPEYLSTKNNRFNKNAKLNTANEDAVSLFVNYNLIQAQKENEKKKYPGKTTVSVEPSDGGGYCKTPECLAIGNVSDQIFYLANESAKALSSNGFDAQVNLYAYGEHAKIPSFELEENVHVQIIPYLYQTKYDPLTMIDEWTDVHSNTSIYDYWKMPLQSYNTPTFPFLDEVPQKLKYWHKQKLQGYMLETTYSKGASGLSLYLAAQLSWDIEANVDSIFEEFLQLSFQEASEPMRNMFILWNDEYHKSKGVAQSVAYLDKASAQSTNEHIDGRLNELKLYVLYLNSLSETIDASKLGGSTEIFKRHLSLIWSLRPFGVVHSEAMHERAMLKLAKKFTSFDRKHWSYPRVKAKQPSAIKKGVMSKGEMIQWYDQILGKLEYEHKARPIEFEQVGANPWDFEIVNRGMMRFFSMDYETVQVNVQFKSKDQHKNASIQIYDNEGNVVWDQKLLSDSIARIELNVKAGAEYTIGCYSLKGRFAFSSTQPIPIYAIGLLPRTIQSDQGFTVNVNEHTNLSLLGIQKSTKIRSLNRTTGVWKEISTTDVKSPLGWNLDLVNIYKHRSNIRVLSQKGLFLVGNNFILAEH